MCYILDYVAWYVEVLESAVLSAVRRGRTVAKPHTPSTPHPQVLKIDYLSWFSATGSSDETWCLAKQEI